MSAVNRHRKGKAVEDSTCAEDRCSLLHFFAWLHRAKGVAASFNLFASARMGAVVQALAEEKALSCKYSRVAIDHARMAAEQSSRLR